MDANHSSPQRRQSVNYVVAGLLVIAFGLVLLAQQSARGQWILTAHLWPLVLIAMGIARASNPEVRKAGRGRCRRPGVWLIIVGCWGLVNEFHIAGFDYDTSWPLLVIGAGILMVWRSFDQPALPSGPSRGDC